MSNPITVREPVPIRTRRDFVRSSLLASAALAPTRDLIGAVPWWWTAPSRDPNTGTQDIPDRLPVAWYRANIARFQQQLLRAGLDGMWLVL